MKTPTPYVIGAAVVLIAAGVVVYRNSPAPQNRFAVAPVSSNTTAGPETEQEKELRIFGPEPRLLATGRVFMIWTHQGDLSVTTYPVKVEMELPSKTNYLVWFAYDQQAPYRWPTSYNVLVGETHINRILEETNITQIPK